MELCRANIYLLEPTVEQADTSAQWAGACRFVYNLALEQRREYGRPGRNINYVSQQSEITALRREVEWLAAVPVHALQMAVRAVDNAFQRFVTGLCGYPRPRDKFKHDTFTLPDPSYLGLKRFHKNHGAVKIPKVGWVKLRGWRPLPGKLRSVATRRKAGHWCASSAWRKDVPEPSNLPSVGIDRGIEVCAALSDGRKLAPLNAFKRIQDKLAKAQRRLAGKTKFSANWRKLKAKITRLHLSAANARKDYLHKLSTEIAKSHGIVKVENLRVRNMSASAKGAVENTGRNLKATSGLNRSIFDQGWGMFAAMLGYTLVERGGKLLKVEAAYTSQTCPEWGVVDATGRISRSEFVCVACGHSDHADIVAARNVHQARRLAVEPPQRTLRRVGKRKQSKEAANAAA